MKKRNTTIFAFLLLAAVGMGVGYAALTDNLSIEGTAKATTLQAEQDWDDDIKFTNCEMSKVQNAANVTCDGDITTDVDEAVLTISGFESIGDKVQVVLTVTNSNLNYDASLAIDTENEWATVITDNQFDMNVEFLGGNIAQKNGGVAKIAVTIELKVQPTTDLTASFSVGYVATTVNP